MTAPAEIQLSNLTLAYDRHPAVHHLSGRFGPGSFTAVVGPNGAGKSTLLKGIVGALKVDAGRISLTGIRRREIAYLPQISEIDRAFPIDVIDLVSLGLWGRTGPFRGLSGADSATVQGAIAAVGMAGFEHRPIASLSGGQMQRALFARLILQDARVILLDEPFTAIDARTAADLLDLVRTWHGEGRTIVSVLHDIELVRQNIPETLLISREPVAWGPTQEVLCAENLDRARRLVEAFDDTAPMCEGVA